MPGFVVHIAQAYKIIAAMETARSLSEAWKDSFITGNLLPDTRLRSEKYISHFWNKKDMNKLAKAPDLEMFIRKYGCSEDDPVIFGYLSHLYLDAAYVRNFWPKVIEFYGRDGEPEEESARITNVRIKKSGKLVPVSSFFSDRYYYGDYTKMNSYFIKKYHIVPPKWEDIKGFRMDEVRLEDMSVISNGLERLRGMSHLGDEKELEVFELDSFEEFMDETCRDFLETYCPEVKPVQMPGQ